MIVQDSDDTANDTTLLSDKESKETTLLSDPSTIHKTVMSEQGFSNWVTLMLGKKRPLIKVLKKSEDHTIGDSNKRLKRNNSHAISHIPIQPGGTKLRDPEAI